MFLRQDKKKTGRTYLVIVDKYRDKDGKSRAKTVECLGYLDVLEKKIDNPIAYYTAYVKKLEDERNAENLYNFSIRADERVDRDGYNSKYYGYIILSKIYHELDLDRFFNNKRRHENFKFNSESIMRLLAYSRILDPDSKRETVKMKDSFFEHFDFSLDDVYDCLTHFSKGAEDAQRHIHQMVTQQYGRDTSLIYYDVTNYYFETEKQDEDRKDGWSKEHRRDPIIQMGLAIDSKGIPMAYKTFPGNTHDSETYIPSLKQIKKEYDVKRAVVVADKGLNCGDNIVFSQALGDGYIFSQSVTGGSDELKAYVLDDNGYTEPTKEGFKRKSRVLPVTVKVTAGVTKNGKKKKKDVPLEAQKQVVFYSPKYAARAKKKRLEALQKAAELINDPSKYSRATHYGAVAYIENLEFDKKTGKQVETGKHLKINEARIAEEEKYDGYYAIITSEIDESDEHIIEMYRGLWRIEETFKITKSVLRTRPIFVYKSEHVGGHFLVCFIALMLLRLVELRLGNRYPAERIAEVLREVTCSHLDTNHYLFHYADEVTDAMNAEFGTDIGLKVMTVEGIRKSIAETKKHGV
jgi:transposase